MTSIQWSDYYSVDNQEIDAQHQKWISICNTMQTTLLYGTPEEVEDAGHRALMEMMAYADYHFRHEENYMRSIGYPEINKHLKLHKNFEYLVYQYNRNVNDSHKLVLNTQVLQLVEKWLINHILIEDKKYAVFAERMSQKDRVSAFNK